MSLPKRAVSSTFANYNQSQKAIDDNALEDLIRQTSDVPAAFRTKLDKFRSAAEKCDVLEQEIMWRSYYHTCMVRRQAYEAFMRRTLAPALEHREKERRKANQDDMSMTRSASRRRRLRRSGRKRPALDEDSDAQTDNDGDPEAEDATHSDAPNAAPPNPKRARTQRERLRDQSSDANDPPSSRLQPSSSRSPPSSSRTTRSQSKSQSRELTTPVKHEPAPQPSRRSSRKRKPRILDPDEVSSWNPSPNSPKPEGSQKRRSPQITSSSPPVSPSSSVILTIPRPVHQWKPPTGSEPAASSATTQTSLQTEYNEYLLSTEGVKEWLEERESGDFNLFTFFCVAPDGHVVVGIRDIASVTNPTSSAYYDSAAAENQILAQRKTWMHLTRLRSHNLNYLNKLMGDQVWGINLQVKRFIQNHDEGLRDVSAEAFDMSSGEAGQEGDANPLSPEEAIAQTRFRLTIARDLELRFGTVESKAHLRSREPSYCVCQSVKEGNMIACDRPDCLVEWYHWTCVGIVERPKKWTCPECLGKKIPRR